MFLLKGIVGPIGVLSIALIYVLITMTSLFMLFKNANERNQLIWFLLIIFFPFVGAASYIFKQKVAN